MHWRSRGGRFRWSTLVAGLALMLVFAACGGGDDEEPTATPEASPTVAAAAVEPTATPEPEPTQTPTPEPTATPTMYVPAPTVAAPLYEPPEPPPAPAVEDEPEPTPAGQEPEPTPETDIPDETEDLSGLLLSTDLTDMLNWQNELGEGYVAEDGFHITNTNSEGIETWERSFTHHQFANVVASIDVKNVGEGIASVACLGVRTGDLGWNLSYVLCLSGYGESFAEFRYIDENDQYLYEELVELAVREGTLPTTEWNTLTIVASGQDLGFFVNDELIGVTVHAGIETGGISFAVGSFDALQAEWVFTNLEVWEVE